MVTPPKTPSRLANKYGKIPFAFPAATQLTGLGLISDALVGRIRWDNLAIIDEVEIILGDDQDVRTKYIDE